MSANNELIIYKDELVWKVKNIDVDVGGVFFVLDEYQSLEDAIKAVQEYMKEEENDYVEYSYRIIF